MNANWRLRGNLWHEKLGKKTAPTSIKSKEETKVNWTLGAVKC